MPTTGRRGRPPRKREKPKDYIAERQGARLRVLHGEKERREGRPITHDEIGEAIGTTGGAYGHYERGRVRIPYEYLVPLARYYEVPVVYILGLPEVSEEAREVSDEARLVCHLVNEMSPEAQKFMVTMTMDQARLDRQRTTGASMPGA